MDKNFESEFSVLQKKAKFYRKWLPIFSLVVALALVAFGLSLLSYLRPQ